MSVLERVRAAEGEDAVGHVARQDRQLVDRLKRSLIERLGLGAIAGMVQSEAPERTREELAVTCRALLNGSDFAGVLNEDRERVISETPSVAMAPYNACWMMTRSRRSWSTALGDSSMSRTAGSVPPRPSSSRPIRS